MDLNLTGTITKKKTLSGALAPTGGSSGPAVVARGTGTNSLIGVNTDEANIASGDNATALGAGNKATARGAVAVGLLNEATANGAVAIGCKITNEPANQATNEGAVALGASNTASGPYASAIGRNNVASGHSSTARGYGNSATAAGSVAVGIYSEATARCAAAVGYGTNANGGNSFVAGRYNIIDTSEAAETTGEREFAVIVGNGTDANNRSNAMTMDWDGNAVFAGKATVGAAPTANMDVATKQYVDNAIPSVPSPASSGTPAMDGTASRGSSTQYARADHVHPTDTSRAAASDLAAKADKVTEVTVSTAGAVTQALDAGKIYHFTGALSALTVTLNAPASGDLAQYHFDFLSGSTAATLTLPNTVVMPSGFTVEANKRYEVDILNNYGTVMSWATS